MFNQFQETINKLTLDKNPAVRFASLYALWPSYNVCRDWTSDRIINLYEQDYRLAGFYDTKNMFVLLYPNYRVRVLELIRKCFESEDDELTKMGAHCITEMYILRNEFVEIMNNANIMSKTQAAAIIEMAILYFDKDEFNMISKNIIFKFKTSLLDLEAPISRLFYDNLIDLERDKEFLIELMSSNLSHRIVHAFIHYLEEESKSIVDYKDIIISMSDYLINNGYSKDELSWGIDDEISKLIIGLYDETSNSVITEVKDVGRKCLDIWDLMFEKQIGSIRSLSQKLMER